MIVVEFTKRTPSKEESGVALPGVLLFRLSSTKRGTLVIVKLRTNAAAMRLFARSCRFVLAVKRYRPGCSGAAELV